MKFYIIIPAHNEDKTISLTLNSLVNQTKLPKKVVVVNDNSDDNTGKIISQFCKKYNWIQTVNLESLISPNTIALLPHACEQAV